MQDYYIEATNLSNYHIKSLGEILSESNIPDREDSINKRLLEIGNFDVVICPFFEILQFVCALGIFYRY